MTPLEIQNAIIPKAFAHAGFPIIEAEQTLGKIPDGPHAIFKFTTADGKDVGQPNFAVEQTAEEYRETMSEDVRVVVSVTAIAEENHASIGAAQAIRNWFTFHGYEDMDNAGIVVVSVGDIGNRDSINEDERRNGFDVTLRVARELSRVSTYIETAEATGTFEK